MNITPICFMTRDSAEAVAARLSRTWRSSKWTCKVTPSDMCPQFTVTHNEQDATLFNVSIHDATGRFAGMW